MPAKLVVTTFLISVGLGYLWALAQIHFKHASPGNPMPTLSDLVARFSGVPWPLEPKPEKPADQPAANEAPAMPKGDEVAAVKIKSIIDSRCARCHKPGGDKPEDPLNNYAAIGKYLTKSPQHPKGQLYTVITATGRRAMSKQNMMKAFFEESLETIDGEDTPWEDLKPAQRSELTPKREAERLAMIAWIEAGAPQKQYEADAFPLPPGDAFKNLPLPLKTVASPVKPEDIAKKPIDKWSEARSRQLSVDALTQSTHAHLLTFSILWALTGIVFAFTHYSSVLRCVLSPLVLIGQVLDVSCWWLARLDGVGPYFALAVMGTGAVVGLGLGAQIVLSLWSMYGGKGRAAILLLFLIGTGLFGLTYVKVIAPQIQAEKDQCAEQDKQNK